MFLSHEHIHTCYKAERTSTTIISSEEGTAAASASASTPQKSIERTTLSLLHTINTFFFYEQVFFFWLLKLPSLAPQHFQEDLFLIPLFLSFWPCFCFVMLSVELFVDVPLISMASKQTTYFYMYHRNSNRVYDYITGYSAVCG